MATIGGPQLITMSRLNPGRTCQVPIWHCGRQDGIAGTDAILTLDMMLNWCAEARIPLPWLLTALSMAVMTEQVKRVMHPVVCTSLGSADQTLRAVPPHAFSHQKKPDKPPISEVSRDLVARRLSYSYAP